MRPLILLIPLALAPLQAGEAEIAKVFEVQTGAWNRGDISTFMDSYEDSRETTFVDQLVLKGYSRVLARYRAQYPNRTVMGLLHFSELDVRLLGTDYAVTTGRFTLTRIESAGGPATGLFTVLMKRVGSDWKIIHDHTSREVSPEQ